MKVAGSCHEFQMQVLCVWKPSEPIDLFMVEQMHMRHRLDTDTRLVCLFRKWWSLFCWLILFLVPSFILKVSIEGVAYDLTLLGWGSSAGPWSSAPWHEKAGWKLLHFNLQCRFGVREEVLLVFIALLPRFYHRGSPTNLSMVWGQWDQLWLLLSWRGDQRKNGGCWKEARGW